MMSPMADRVHPHSSPPAAAAAGTLAPPPLSAADRPSHPKSGTYVIQLPKDQIYRVPSPDSARRFQEYSRRALRTRRPSSRRLLASLAAALLLLLLSLAAAAGTLFLLLRPNLPRYSISSLSVTSLNPNSTSAVKIDARITAENPNRKLSITYLTGGSSSASYYGFLLCNGAWPEFRQDPRNATVVPVAMRGAGIRLCAAASAAVAAGAVRIEVDVRVPVRVNSGVVRSWTVNVKARCEVTVDKMTADARIVSSSCKSRLNIF